MHHSIIGNRACFQTDGVTVVIKRREIWLEVLSLLFAGIRGAGINDFNFVNSRPMNCFFSFVCSHCCLGEAMFIYDSL